MGTSLPSSRAGSRARRNHEETFRKYSVATCIQTPCQSKRNRTSHKAMAEVAHCGGDNDNEEPVLQAVGILDILAGPGSGLRSRYLMCCGNRTPHALLGRAQQLWGQ